jgi:hypothetical protein
MQRLSLAALVIRHGSVHGLRHVSLILWYDDVKQRRSCEAGRRYPMAFNSLLDHSFAQIFCLSNGALLFTTLASCPAWALSFWYNILSPHDLDRQDTIRSSTTQQHNNNEINRTGISYPVLAALASLFLLTASIYTQQARCSLFETIRQLTRRKLSTRINMNTGRTPD